MNDVANASDVGNEKFIAFYKSLTRDARDRSHGGEDDDERDEDDRANRATRDGSSTKIVRFFDRKDAIYVYGVDANDIAKEFYKVRVTGRRRSSSTSMDERANDNANRCASMNAFERTTRD